jgi:hypothetical protein
MSSFKIVPPQCEHCSCYDNTQYFNSKKALDAPHRREAGWGASAEHTFVIGCESMENGTEEEGFVWKICMPKR